MDARSAVPNLLRISPAISGSTSIGMDCKPWSRSQANRRRPSVKQISPLSRPTQGIQTLSPSSSQAPNFSYRPSIAAPEPPGPTYCSWFLLPRGVERRDRELWGVCPGGSDRGLEKCSRRFGGFACASSEPAIYSGFPSDPLCFEPLLLINGRSVHLFFKLCKLDFPKTGSGRKSQPYKPLLEELIADAR